MPSEPLLRRLPRFFYPAIVAAALLGFSARANATDRNHWVGTWSASMQAPIPGSPAAIFDNVTLREVVHVSVGGKIVRVRFSNSFGTDPLVIDGASIGVRSTGASVVPGTLRTLTFAGETSISIAPGGVALSDPVLLTVAPLSDLAISLHVPSPESGVTQLTLAHQRSYVSPHGNFAGATDMPAAQTITSWYWLSGVEVVGDDRAVVTFGDSITEGFNSTLNANMRWPDVLARRLQADGRTQDVAVLNEAISGNRVLNDVIGPNAQKRIDRDVLTQGGLTYVTLLLGTNDLGFSQLAPGTFGPGVSLANVSAAEVIAGYQQIILRVHQAGAKIYGCTMLPFEGAGYYDSGVEPKRAAINEFIRNSGEFDAVIDFDKVMRDPTHPTRIRPEFDSGDHLHPNDAGYKAMANSINLDLFVQ